MGMETEKEKKSIKKDHPAEEKASVKMKNKPKRSRSDRSVEEPSSNEKSGKAGKKVNLVQETGEAAKFLARGIGRVFTALGSILLTVLLIGGLCALIVGTAFAVYLSGYVDSSIDEFEILASEQKRTSQIFVDDGMGNLSELEDQKLYMSENRVYVDYEDIPQNLIDAYISTEDKRFYDHNGVDWLRTIKATVYYALGNSAGGGSTLTQQLIKNATGNNDNTPQRKIGEIFQALNLEKNYSKEQILEMYLNTIYLSQGCYGVQSASYTYFGKPVKELNLLECAAIASITQNPSKWDPKLHPENNIIRRNSILENMLEQGKITKAEFDSAYNAELTIYDPEESEDPDNDPGESSGSATGVNSWYVDAVIEDAIELLMERYEVNYNVGEQMLYTGGFRIVTAMDPKVQQVLEEVFTDTDIIDEIIGASPGMVKPQSAIVVLDTKNGNILGLVGGRGEKYKSRLFNFATQAHRQTGSAMKPLSVYGPALESGIINYATVFDDSPYSYDDEGNGWPKNSPAVYRGLTPVITGITNSVNTMAVKILDRLGIENSFNFLTEKMHITTLYRNKVINGSVYNDLSLPALALGGMTEGVSVRELAGGFTTFTNEGVYCQPRTVLKILDSKGNTVVDNALLTEECLSRENASIMTKMMNNVVVNGTGSSIKLKNYVFTAGKTGTTTKNNDKWFVGYTPYYLGGVWFGYERAQSLGGFSGNPAMKIWDYAMTKLHEELVFTPDGEDGFDYQTDRQGNAIPKIYSDVIDPGVLTLQFCQTCGKLATEKCKKVYHYGTSNTQNMTATGYFTADNMPTESCTCHVEVTFCTAGNHLASEACPEEYLKKRVITVVDSAKDRYTYNGKSVYAYRSDEKAVFYAKGDGTYGGFDPQNPFDSFCTKHSQSSELPLASAPVAATPTEKSKRRKDRK